MQAVFDSLTAHIAVLDTHGTILAVNPAWTRFALENGGAACASPVGRSYLDVCGCDGDVPYDGREGATQALAGIQDVLAGRRGQYTLEYPCHSPTESRWFLLYASPLNTAQGAVIAHINITERKRAELDVAHQAYHDALTGLPNRALFTRRLEEALHNAPQEPTTLALLFLDLDGFKAVNDRLGHDAGDLLLVAVAERLRRCIRGGDMAARLAGDEFTVVLPDIRSREHAAAVAQKILTHLAAPIALGAESVTIGASIGIGIYPEHGHGAEILLKRADTAMYLAKRDGKNRFRFA